MQSLTNGAESEVWPQIAPMLEDAMGKVSEKERSAIALRFFEGKTFQEIGTSVGASENAAKKRVGHGLEKLRAYFLRRGVASTTAIIAGAISTQSVQAAPAALVTATTAIAIAKGAAASSSTLILIQGALKLMAWTKAKTAVVGAGVLLAAGTATVTISSHRTSDALSARVERILRQKMLPGQNQWRAGMDELWSLGHGVIPRLASQARRKDPVLARAYARLWKETPTGLRRYLAEPVGRAELRQAAMHAIAEFGPLAVRRAAPQVIDGLTETDDQYNNYAVSGARWLLPESAKTLAVLDAGLAGTNANWPPPQTFLNVDLSAWPNISEVVPLLTNLLGNAGVAYHAAIGLGVVGPDAAPAIPALIQTVDLGAAGPFPDAEAARYYTGEVYDNWHGLHLARLRQDDKGMNHNRAMAVLALGRIGVATPEVTAALARAWNAPDSWVRHNAALAVALVGAPMTNNLRELLDGLLDYDNAALENKLAAIGKLGPAARDGLGTLRELTQANRVRDVVQERDLEVVGISVDDLVVAAKMAICRIDPQEGRPFLPEIANKIGYWWDPVEFLVKPGPLSNDVVRAVEPLLERTGNTTQLIGRQCIAAYVILRHDRKHSKALAVLRRNKSTGELNDRLFAGRLLFESLGETNGLCSLIAEGFRAPESFIGQTAGQIAEKMGDAALPAVPAFRAALWHRDQFVRDCAGRLILKLAPQELPINGSE